MENGMNKNINWEKGLFRLYIIPSIIGIIFLWLAAYEFFTEEIVSFRHGFYYFNHAAWKYCSGAILFYLRMFVIFSLLPWILHLVTKKLLIPLLKWFEFGFHES